jgi:ribosomal protein S17
MKIILNSKEEILDTAKPSLTINEVRAIKKYSFKSLVVKINGQLVKRENFDSAECREGDRVQLIETRPMTRLKRWRVVKKL